MVWVGFGFIAIFFAAITVIKILDAITELERRVSILEAKQPDKPLPPGLPPEYYKFTKGGEDPAPRPMERLLTPEKMTHRYDPR